MPQSAKKQEVSPQDLQGEFVSGGYSYASTQLSLETYDRHRPNLTQPTREAMRYDSEVESSVEILIDAVFADGIQPLPAVTDDEAEDFKEANEIAEFIRAATATDTPRTLEAVMREIFRGSYYAGVKAGEIVLKLEDARLILDRVNPKPSSAISFVCDRFYNVLGLASWNRNYSSDEIAEKREEIIPREKFVILQLELEDNDPRGVARIRAVYDDYCDKKLTREQYKEWRRTSAIPKKYGITPPGAKDVPLRDANGAQIVKNNIPQTISAEKALMGALEGYANNSTVTAPHGTEIGQLEVQGNGEQFTKALKFNNSGIRKAVLGDSVSTGEDDKGVKAAKEVAIDVVDLRVRTMKGAVADCIRRDIYRLLTVLNFGAEKAHLTPRCSLGDTERRDWATDAGALQKVGYRIAPEHLPEADAMLGFKPRKNVEPVETPDDQNNFNSDDDPAEDEG